MIQSVDIQEFLELSKSIPIVDARSESEFESGHIPIAHNIPILNNEQRKIVGTLYKQNGREAAVYKGLELLGPNMSTRLKQGVKIAQNGQVLVHCWRGGMRSEFFAFLLKFYGLQPILLKGGYKSFRGKVHDTFNNSLQIIVLGGRTGSGKTILLEKLKELGEQIIDLEQLANHRGSSFGGLGMEVQPTQEQFENDLYDCLSKLDPNRIVWIEDENRTIGRIVIPEAIWSQMKSAKKIYLDRDFDERIDQIMTDYSGFSKENLIHSMNRIGKRLGPQHVKKAIEYLENGEIREAFKMALVYYDKAYIYGLGKSKSGTIKHIEGIGLSYDELANLLIAKNYGNS